MALTLSPCECERSLAAPVTYVHVLSSRGRELDDVQKDPVDGVLARSGFPPGDRPVLARAMDGALQLLWRLSWPGPHRAAEA